MHRLALAVILAIPLASIAQAPKGPKLPDGVTTEKNIAYGPHERNKLDVYLPKGDKPLPLVIWVHGGAWSAGSKDGNNPALKLLEKGYAVAAINYRLSQHAIFPAQIEDCLAAVRYLRANAKKFNLNPEAFGAWGGSAGGHLVALMATAAEEKAFLNYGSVKEGSSKVQAVCDWYGPIDFTLMNKQTTVKGPIDHDAKDAPEAKLIGGPVQDNKEKSDKANPMKYISKSTAPLLILHGDKDPLVPVGQSEMFQDALAKAGCDSKLIVVTGVGHDGRVGDGKNGEAIVEFFDKHLKK